MRMLINLLITTGLLLVLNAFEWLTLSDHGTAVDIEHLTWPIVGNVVLVAVILWLMSIVVSVLYVVVGCLSLGIMFLAYPFIGWATLEVVAYFMPDTLTLYGFWITTLCGFLLMSAKIHPKKGATDEE